MRLLLSGDEYCCLLNGKFYVSETGRTHIFRYLKAFDNILVAFRTKKVDSATKLEKYSVCIEDERVEFVDIPFFQGPKQFVPKYLKIKRAIKGVINRCDFAILRLPSTTAFVAWQVVMKENVPYATEIVFDCYDAMESSETFLDRNIWKYLHNMQVKACNNAVGVSCVTKEYLQKRYFPTTPSALTSHYSSIELEPGFFSKARKYPTKDIFRIIHIANQVQFNGRKGHNELLDVVSKLNRSGKRVEIYFIGEDYDKGVSRLSELASKLGIVDSVFFTGYIDKKQLRKELLNADIAILPTKAEGLPRVVIEAMALGLPCITSPVSGNPELINSEFLVNYDDVDGMVNACEKLLYNPALYEKESRENFDRSLEYSNEILNPRRTSFYEGLIKIAKNRV